MAKKSRIRKSDDQPHKLTDIRLDEISLVDQPANPGARVLLMKRRAEKMEARTFNEVTAEQENRREVWEQIDALSESLMSILNDEDVTDKAALIGQSIDEFRASFGSEVMKAVQTAKQLSEGDTDMDELKKVLESLELSDDAIAKITKAVTDHTEAVTKERDEAIEKAKASDESAEALKKAEEENAGLKDEIAKLKGEDDPVKKALAAVPDEVKKALDPVIKQNEELAAKVAKQERDAEVAEIAKGLGDLSFAKALDMASVIHALRKDHADLAETVEKATKAAAEQIEKSTMFGELGNSRRVQGEAATEITKMAEEHVAKNGGSIQSARVAVRKANPDLAQREREESRAN